jgi:hypothetical protein
MSNTNGRAGPNSSNRTLDRAFAAGAWLCAGVVTMTGIFIARIDNSSAVANPGSNIGTNSDSGKGTTVLPGICGQVAPAPRNQVPQGKTHGY